MVIILLIFACLAAFASAMFLQKASQRIPAVIFSSIIMIGATTMMVLNYHSHLGMKQVTTTTTQTVEPVSAKLPIALYQPLGTAGNEEVLMYRSSANGKVKHTPADENISSKMKFANVSSLTMKTRKTTWQFKNGFYHLLFLWSGMDGTLVKKQTTITYPREFVKVTPKQMKKLKAALTTANTTNQTAQKQALDMAVEAKLAQHPQATAQQKQAIAQQVQRQAAAKMIKQALAK